MGTGTTRPAAASARAYFGSRLRHWRRLRGLTQAQLARRLGYDHTQISRIESGERWPPPGFAGGCDAALDTGGELAALWPLVDAERERAATEPSVGAVTVPPYPSLLAGGAVPLAGFAHAGSASHASGAGAHAAAACAVLVPAVPHTPDRPALTALWQLLAAYGRAEVSLGGADLAEPVEHQTRALLRGQAGLAGPEAGVLRLTSRYAELAGWLRFDCRQYDLAAFWYDLGYRLALAAGDHDEAATLLARQSTVRWELGDAVGALELAAAAQTVRPGLHPHARAWAALAEARGWALAGDPSGCERKLGEATAAYGVPAPEPPADSAADPAPDADSGRKELAPSGGPVVTEAVVRFVRGTCYRELAERTGRPEVARRGADEIAAAAATVPWSHTRDRALLSVRRAAAHAAGRQPEHAADALGAVVGSAAGFDSPRVRQELHRVHAGLRGRWPDLRAVRDLTDRLYDARLLALRRTAG
jgi:hypothetical protein